MKIVVVTPAVPHPPSSTHPFVNTASRWYCMLVQQLAQRGHEVTCLSFSNELESLVEESRKILKESEINFFHFPQMTDRNLLRRKIRSFIQPYSEVNQQKDLKETLSHLLKETDILHLEQLYTGWLQNQFPRTLLNIHHLEIIDWEERNDLNWNEKKELLQMNRATRKLIKNSCYLRTFTPRLQEKILKIHPSAKSWVIPLGLDLNLYPLLPKVKDPMIGLIGSMHWYPTRSAAIRLLTRIGPLVQKEYPQVKFRIAGWNAKKYLSPYLGFSQNVILEENIHHPKDFFSRIAVMVYAPSRGSGMKLKVFESMAYGVPLVTTEEGAEGIEYQNGKELLVEETDEKIAQAILSLLKNFDQQMALRTAARKLLEEKYSPKPILDQIENVYQQIAMK